MKKLFLSITLLLSATTLQCLNEQPAEQPDQKKTFKMSSAKILFEQLNAEGFEHFVEKTKIHKKLGDRELYPEGIMMAIELSLYDYSQYVQNRTVDVVMSMRKRTLITTILKECKEKEDIIKILEEKGLLGKN